MSWKTIRLGEVLKQYRVTHLVQNDSVYKQVTISKHHGVSLRGEKQGIEIGRKRQFKIDLQKYPNTLLMIRQGVQDGGIGIAPSEVDGCIATENMPMFSIENIEPDYLKHFLQTEIFKKQLNMIQAVGSAQKAVHERELLKITMPLPPSLKQIEVVAGLNKAEAQLNQIDANLTRQQAQLTDLKQAILREAVQGQLTARWRNTMEGSNPPASKAETGAELLARIRAHKQKLILEGKLKKEKPLPPITPADIPFDLPDGWVWCRLGEVGSFMGGGTPSKDNPEYWNGTIPWVSPKDMKVDEIETALDSISEIAITQSSTKLIPVGSILMVVRGMILAHSFPVAITLKEVTINQDMKALVPHTNLKEFIIICLKGFKQTILQNIDRSTHGTCKMDSDYLLNFPIPLPPISEQQAIVARVGSLLARADAVAERLAVARQQAGALRQAVLREAFEQKEMSLTD